MLEYLAAGMKDEAIARALGVSARTVRRRVAHLESCFGATNRIQLVARAATSGWVRV
ncbi:MAG: HTH domain-containing protein [Streptosporangiales bacterium]|nr:HTH domain-containing protein [Streptosporangiales bacterium]